MSRVGAGKEGGKRIEISRALRLLSPAISGKFQEMKREIFGPRVPPPTRGRWIHWAFSYFIFGVVIAHAKKKKRYSHVSRLSATNYNRGPSDHSFFFYVTIDWNHKSCCHRHSLAVAK